MVAAAARRCRRGGRPVAYDPAMSTLAAANPVPLRDDAPTIGAVSVAHGLSHFCQLVVPPLFPFIGAAYGLSNTQLGALMSVFFVVSSCGQFAAGFVVDRFGAPRVLYAGLALLAVAALGLAASPAYAVMLAFMAVAGLGNSVFHPVDFSILNGRVSTPRLGHAYAAHGISGNLGWALAPVFVVGIATASGSWRLALASVSAVVLAVLAALVWRRDWLRVRPPAAAAHAAAHAAAPATAAAAAPGARTAVPAAAADGAFAFLRLPAVWSCFAFFLLNALALGAMQSFAPQAAGQLHQVPVAQVAMFLSIFMAAAAAGMVLGGHLARDPERCAHIVAAGYGGAAVVALALAFGTWPPAAVAAMFALMGVGSGLAGPSRDLLVKSATPPGATGRVYGVVYSGLDVGMTIAPLVFGLLMDAGAWREVWLLVAALQVLLIAGAFNVRRQRRRVMPASAA
jgi:MFS family permease